MSNTQAPATVPADLPERPGRLVLFGVPPVIAGENEEAYRQLYVQISATVKPSDILEQIWVADAVDLTWEGLRLRRLKASLMMATAHQGLENILKPLIGPTDALALASDWAARDDDAIKQVDDLLASAGLTMDAVMAETLSVRLDDIERFDRMIAAIESRRSAILREVDRHRAAAGQHLRRAIDEAEDAEFEVVNDGVDLDATWQLYTR